MDTYNEEERDYHMKLIEDVIDFREGRKDSLEYPFEEHIDLVYRFNAHVGELSDTTDIVSVHEYIELYHKSDDMANEIIKLYDKQREINFVAYYDFCKVIERMMQILVNETGNEDIADFLAKMKM